MKSVSNAAGSMPLQALINSQSQTVRSEEASDSSSPSDNISSQHLSSPWNNSQNYDNIRRSNGHVSSNGNHIATNHQAAEDPAEYEAAIMDEPPRPLRWWDVSSLIINKMVGTGIYTAPPAVLLFTGSKREALSLWIVGFLYTLVR